MISSVSGTTDAAAGAAAMKKATGMNKDDFLKLFVAQLQNQDPLNPQDGAQFITQLAQLTQVEQAYNTNSNLVNMLNAQNNATAVYAVSLIGKDVLTAGSQVQLTAGSQAELNYRMPEEAENVSLEITDADDKVVRTLTGGKTAAGDFTIQWDGKNDKNVSLPSGTYSFAVTGTDAAGNEFSGTSLVRGKVDSLKLDGTSPVLTINGLDLPLESVLSVKGG